MTYENFKTLKNHIATVLRMDVKQVEKHWRELSAEGSVHTEAGRLGKHTPTERSLHLLLAAIARSRLGSIRGPIHKLAHNHSRTYRDLGVVFEAHGGVYVRVEIAPSDVRSILDFGKAVGD